MYLVATEHTLLGSHIDILVQVKVKTLHSKKIAQVYENNNMNPLSNKIKKVNNGCLQYISLLIIANSGTLKVALNSW